jgi:hypothetical protein
MLLGTTFAWFTDSAASGSNVIKSGNLDMEVEYTLDGTNWNKLDGATDLFQKGLWEPGHTEVVALRITNKGSLALKYAANMNIVKEVVGKNNDGGDIVLSDILQVSTLTIEDAGIDPALGMNIAAETLKKAFEGEDMIAYDAPRAFKSANVLEAGSPLYAGSTQYVFMKVDMPEAVGNEANHDGKNVPSIEFGINVLATQFTEEEDSFGDQYDANAWTEVAETPKPDENGVVDVYSAQQLAGVMANTAGIKTINIKEDIDLNGRSWAPAYVSAPDLVINGNGHTISNMTTSGKDYQGFIGVAYQNLTINDLTFENAKVDSNKSFTGGVIGWAWGNADVTFDNVDVIDSEVSASIANVAIRVGGLIGFFPYDGGNLTLKNCDVSGSTITGYHNVGAMVGTTLTQKTVTIENCTAKNNTLVHSGTNVGAFDFGAGLSGYEAYIPTSGFTAENNTVICRVYTDAQLAAAIKSPAFDLITVASGEYGVIDVRVNRKLTIAAQDGADVKIAGINGQSNNNASDITIKGITIDNSLATAGWYTGTAQNIKPCVGVWGGDYTFEDCDFNVTGEKGAETGVMSWWTTNHGTMTFKGCTFNGGNGSARGMQIYGNYDLNVEDCTFTTAKDYAIKYVGAEDCKATLTGNNVYNTKNFVQAGSGAYPGKNYTIEFKNNILADGINNLYVDNYENQTIIVDGAQLATNNDMLKAAIANGATKVMLTSGEYVVPNAVSGKSVTIIGNGETVIDITTVPTYAGLHGATITFENVTINSDPQGAGYNRGFAHTNKITYNNCVINGTLGLNTGDTEFNGCTFNISGDYYSLWTWGADNVTLNNCTFNSDGKAVLLYGQSNTKLTVNGCTFNDNGGLADLKAAIEIGNDYNKSYELIVNNTTVNGYEINDKGINTGSTLWANKNSMGTDKLNVVVDGVDVY